MKTIVCHFCKHEREVYSGSELISFRKRAGLTLREAAKLLDCSVAYINDCENNRRDCSSAMTAFWKNYEMRNMVFKE